jgi:hypothetical protein
MKHTNIYDTTKYTNDIDYGSLGIVVTTVYLLLPSIFQTICQHSLRHYNNILIISFRYLQRAKRQAALARKAGLTLIVIGVGPQAEREELLAIAGTSDGSHLYHVNNFAELRSIVPELAMELCHGTILTIIII